jgi:hypothetical protein
VRISICSDNPCVFTHVLDGEIDMSIVLSMWQSMPTVVDVEGVIIPSLDTSTGPVSFLDNDAICRVEDYVLRQAALLGWCVQKRTLDAV